MSLYDHKSLGSIPDPPPSGYLRLFNDGSSWKYINPAGSVFTFSTGVTAEEVQDIVGAFFADSSTINVTYNDAGDTLTADVVPSAIDHNQLLNFVANKHIDHSAVSIVAGAGLSGGGDLTATRTLTNADRGSVAVSTHEAALDPHPQYLTAAEGNAAYQPIDGDLTALSGLAGTGLIARTATDTATTRTISAGTGISVSNGDGVSGNPTVTNTDLGSTAVASHVAAGDPHTQYALETTTISAGSGLTGGGDLSANRTIAMPNVGTAGTYGSGSLIPVITTDAQGRVSNVTTAAVTSIFGSEYEYQEDLTTATTTLPSFQTGATFTTGSKSAGTFRIGIHFNWTINVTNADAQFRVQVDGATVGSTMQVENSETVNQSYWEYVFVNVTFATATTHTVTLQFANEVNGNTISLFQTRMEMWRVS